MLSHLVLPKGETFLLPHLPKESSRWTQLWRFRANRGESKDGRQLEDFSFSFDFIAPSPFNNPGSPLQLYHHQKPLLPLYNLQQFSPPTDPYNPPKSHLPRDEPRTRPDSSLLLSLLPSCFNLYSHPKSKRRPESERPRRRRSGRRER